MHRRQWLKYGPLAAGGAGLAWLAAGSLGQDDKSKKADNQQDGEGAKQPPPLALRPRNSDLKITDVKALLAPNSNPTRMALPLLRESALKAQSADIDTVSGATATSDGYKQSLQAAIDGAQ